MKRKIFNIIEMNIGLEIKIELVKKAATKVKKAYEFKVPGNPGGFSTDP